MNLMRRCLPLGLLAALALLYFSGLVFHPARTLYSDHSDLIALHVPLETFLCRSWHQTGKLPLWNPLQFSGLPFGHDIHAAIFYPPHWILLVIDEASVGAALSWLVVGHVILAGWGMYAYSRSTGLVRTASIVAAVGWMFAGKWLLHLVLAGHYAYIGLAWLPLVLLGLERAVRRSSLPAATWAGVAFGLLALSTQPQITIYAGVFLAAWTLPVALEPSERRLLPKLFSWAGAGAWTALVGAGIAAVQLAPTLELATFSTRGLAGLPETQSITPRTLLRALGPSPDGVHGPASWESSSGLGVVWIAVAVAALAVTAGATRRRVRWALWLVVAMVLFALMGGVVFHGLPIFKMFRSPARMFLMVALPLAYVAGLTTQALCGEVDGACRLSWIRARQIAVGASVALCAAISLGIVATSWRDQRPHVYCLSLAVTVPAACWLVGLGPDRFSPVRRVAWVLILIVDLAAQSWPHVQVRRLDDVLAPSLCARNLAVRCGPLDRVLDRSCGVHPSDTPLGPAVAARLGIPLVRGYNPLNTVRYKEFLALISYPQRVRHPSNGLENFPIMDEKLLDLLGVRFLVQPLLPELRLVPAEVDPDQGSLWQKLWEDAAPAAFVFANGGVRTLPAYEVLESRNVMPRAFVVPGVARLPQGARAVAQAMTTTDFRRVALVEEPAALDVVQLGGSYRPATITTYQSNRVEIDADGPGLLVLTDPWYPGWVAVVDGRRERLYRADYLFRGVPLAAGRHMIAFEFRPRSYMLGWTITVLTVALVVLTIVIGATCFNRQRC
jgi:Bacterial membrane protein YfhO